MEVLSILFFVCLLVIAFLGGLLICVLSKEEPAPSASTNIPMQANAQICQNIVEDQLGYLFRIGLDFNEGEEDSVRDNLYRIVAGKLLHG